MKSMTGFGTSNQKNDEIELQINIRSVNGRFFEPRIHLPREYMELESNIKKTVNASLKRGTIDIYVNRKLSPEALQSNVSVRKEMAVQWKQAYETLAAHAGLQSNLDLRTLAGLPQVLKMEETFEVIKGEKEILDAVLVAAITACDFERAREGASLKTHLGELLAQLSQLVESILAEKEVFVSELRDKYLLKIKTLIEDREIDESRMLQEVAVLVDKSDVTEELTRLSEHIENCTKLLGAEGPIGKKLDFYTQELLREVNTIGSKSTNSKITGLVVESKTTVEKFREQVQNVE